MPTTFANTIDGNEILAKRSQCDYDGNDIQTTYATKSELPSASQLVPTSTPADADKVLTVDSQGIPGWAVVSASDVFVAKYNTTTWTDVSTAYADGKVIFLEVTDASIPYPYRLNSTAQIPLAAIRTGSVGACAVFIGSSLGTTTGTGENTSWPVYILGSNNTWTTQTRRAYPSFTSSDYNKVLTVVNNGSNFPVLQWSATQSGGVTDVEVDGTSVVSGGVASITMPTVDQTYDASSANAQSGTAVAEAIATKEDAFDVGTGLEMDTSGSTPTLQVEAPVDIVAGPGIAIDNPDGNTMRITNTGFPISATDAVLCGTFRGDPMYTKTYAFTGTVGTSETTISMTIDEKRGTNNVNRIWIDPSTSFILYGSAGVNILPLSWRLGSSRQGSVAVLGASAGSLSCRCVDTSSTPITLNITIRYTVSNS